MSRDNILRVVTVSIPVLFFVLVEAILRLTGYGETVHLFIENPAAPQYLTPRPDAVMRYFPDKTSAPNVTIETNFFLRDKPPNGLRLVVQGGSTAAGFPFGYGASIAGMLDYRLKQSFPDRTVEVISTALAAVNSYTMLDFVDEIIARQPDAVLLYAGHNEYLGILGVGSTYSAANSQVATRLYLRVKNLRLFQLMQQVYVKIRQKPLPEHNAISRTFMAKVAKHKDIPYGSPMFEQGLAQFRTNISLIIAKYQAAKIPVFISTIGSNLAAQAPFSSAAIPTHELDPMRAPLERIKTSGQGSLSTVELNKLLDLAERYRSAELNFSLAAYYVSRDMLPEALGAYTRARDYDLLRFRAPSEINEIVMHLADVEGVHLVDANSALEFHSENGIIGSSLMLEHLHPTLEGYFVIADAFYQKMQQSNVFGKFPHYVDSARARAEIPVLAAEEYYGKAKIAGLMADYPFSDQPVEPTYPPRTNWNHQLGYRFYEKKIGWLEMANESFLRSGGEPLYRLKNAKILADALPHKADLNYQAGVTLIQSGRALEAPRYLLRAIDADEYNVNYQLALSHAYILQERFADAIPWIESVLKLEPSNNTALAVQRQFHAKKR